jgi:phosphoribosylformylglycinamidine cyclo-ligase
VPNIFKLIQKYGKITEKEMYSVFNMGIGMILFVRPDNVTAVKKKIPGAKIIGEIVEGTWGVRLINQKLNIKYQKYILKI